jgi:sugar/nucleoside kinase (ribokinase family)
MSANGSLVVVGSVALDTVETADGVHREVLGGSASFFVAAASLFVKPSLVAVVGDDFPEEHLEFLSERADLAGLVRAPGRTFRWHGRYSPDFTHRETLETQLNVFEQFRPSLPSLYREAQMLFLGNIDPELQLEVLAQVPSARLVAGDTMNLWIGTRRDLLKQVLKRLHLLILNEEEARQLSERWQLGEAARAIQDMGPRDVLIKRGDAGALLFSEGDVFSIPAYPVARVIDPTGAGDSFAGGLLGALSRDGLDGPLSLRRAIAHATAVASFTVEDISVRRLREVTIGHLEERVEGLRRMVTF